MLTEVSNFGGNVVGWSVEQAGDSLSEIGQIAKYLSLTVFLSSSIGTTASIAKDELLDGSWSGYLTEFVVRSLSWPQLISGGTGVAGALMEATGRKVHDLGSCLRDPGRSVFKLCAKPCGKDCLG